MAERQVKYLVFDVESVADGELVQAIKYPGEELTAEAAIRKYRDELLEEKNSDFIPYTFQIPISVVVGKVDREFRLMDLVALDGPQYRSHVITEHFWRGWSRYKHPTLVTFNGRSFDLPLLELCTFRYGISVRDWFDNSGRTYEQPRNRYNTRAHLDLQDCFSNFGAVRGFHGGLNLASKILGKPGKMDTQGYMVQDMFHEGRISEINDYCHCDVLDTYFVFLRWQVMLGQLTVDKEQEIVRETKTWLEEKSTEHGAYAAYLANWGGWRNPWKL